MNYLPNVLMKFGIQRDYVRMYMPRVEMRLAQYVLTYGFSPTKMISFGKSAL